jgi:hypothetical protein
MSRRRSLFSHKEGGQSIIEVIFFLIILLILIAGIVELGAILQTKLTVTNAARQGARIGAQGSSDEDITLMTQATIAQVIDCQKSNTEIWVIHAKTDGSGDIGDGCPVTAEHANVETYWCVEHTLGDDPLAPDDDKPPFVTRQDIQDTQRGASNTEVVAVAVSYDHRSIIGLPYSVGGGGLPITTYNVARVESTVDE